jgi:16S rRNA G966 N2-methylase RsmD
MARKWRLLPPARATTDWLGRFNAAGSMHGYAMRNRPSNQLFYGDNLAVLRKEISDASIDLVYLDPPFNSNANYNILFKSPAGMSSDAQIEAFEDSWHWNIPPRMPSIPSRAAEIPKRSIC